MNLHKRLEELYKKYNDPEFIHELSPDDPARYDFALTRLGIRKDGDINDFFGSI